MTRRASLAANATADVMGMTLGCSTDYSTAKSAITKYSGAFQFAQPDFTAAAKLCECIGKAKVYTGSYYHNVSGCMQARA